MVTIDDPSFHMWFVLGLTALAVFFFVREKVPLEVTSVGLLTILLLFGQFFPLSDPNGSNLLDSRELLEGFANPSLVSVLALLIVGQGMIHTNALRWVTQIFVVKNPAYAVLSFGTILLFVMIASAFMNNTPLVIIAIPIMQALAASAGKPESRVMIPLSFAAILGGMTTLIGSSTNLLVSSAMTELGYEPLKFFDFLVPGLILAGTGFLYVFLIAPFLLPDRSSMVGDLAGSEKEFIAELDIAADSRLIGMESENGKFPKLPDLNIRLIQRAGHLILPPFEGYVVEKGDILIVAATRSTLTELLSNSPGFWLSEETAKTVRRDLAEDELSSEENRDEKAADTRVLAEVMIPPASRMVDMSLEHAGFSRQLGVLVLGIQRRARVVRRRMGRIRLEPGDVLLVAGPRENVDSLRVNPDLIVLSGSRRELPAPGKAPLAIGIFLATIGLAAGEVISISVSAITGSVLMIATGCLNIRQATRAVDRKILLLVGSMLALGHALQVTGGAAWIADSAFALPFAGQPLPMAAFLFLIVAVFTNVLTNNACAILFTPVALNMAADLGVDPLVFAVTVIFAANCSFASPIGYQTNLLVMGPGHYRFRDFLLVGVPLVLLLWVVYILIAWLYFGLGMESLS